ncbi:hypothetical protein GCM10019059_37280 [Camelimonas fluminis]|uniref:GumC family protein n=1 Tax=Camelimonas fluminis TaxID=1576911 RepID=A0ABV7UGI9_9HYPH|nr:polysaccharide biosynthesis tyrosine autokinase [Camelimonas fluminis]GHE74292.1 hypothetical protein GCM10019059_37280 [Camelimonas fluminis]
MAARGVNALRRHRPAMAGGAALGLLAAGLALAWLPQQWQAFADIELAPPRTGSSGRIDDGAGPPDAAVENQGLMALSRPVLLRALANAPDLVARPHRDPALALRDQFAVRRLPRTMVWRITATAQTPDIAASLEARLPALAQQLQASERAAALWRRQHALVAGGDASGASLAEKQLADMNGRLAQARAAAIDARTRLERFSAATPGDDGENISPAMQGMRRQMTDLARRDADLATRYGPQYPERAAMRAQIGAMAKEISAERERITKTLGIEADIAAAREAAMRRSLDASQTEAAPQGGASDQAIRLRELERQAAADRTAYEAALARLRRSQEMAHVADPEARIMSPAVAGSGERLASPFLLMIMGAAGGAIMVLGVALLRENMVDPCLCPEQVATDLGLARVAEAPMLGPGERKARGHVMQPATTVALRPHSRFAESFRAVRMTLEATRAHPALLTNPGLPEPRRGRIVLVTSGQPGDGKTTTAIGLALSLAEAGHRVVLVDADLRNAGLSRYFDLRAHLGLADMLRAGAPFASASVRRANVAVVPAGAMAGGAKNPLSLVDISAAPLLHRMALAFDHVVVDAPPMDVTEDASVLLRTADTAVLALRWGRTPRCLARRMAARLAAHGKLGAVMLTRVNPARTPRYGSPAVQGRAAMRRYFHG